jgi:hypothetical protein
MSGSLAGAASLVSVAQQGLAASGATSLLPSSLQALIKTPRAIGTIIPDVVIDERHSDRVTVTQHPVADNTPVADHAFRLPATLTMKVGFTNSNLVGSAVQGFTSGGGFSNLSGGLSGAGSGIVGALTEQRVKTVYERLLALQLSRVPFTVTTGKRTYPQTVSGVTVGNDKTANKIGSMVITEISVTTDHTTEYSLILEVHMTEVIRVTTTTTSQPATSDQANPQKTASPQDTGTKDTKPAADNDDSPLLTAARKLGYTGPGAAPHNGGSSQGGAGP